MDEDADLIVFLRNNIKALLTLAEALAAEVEEYRGQLGYLTQAFANLNEMYRKRCEATDVLKVEVARLAAAEKQRDEAVRSLKFIYEHSGQRVAAIHADKALQRIAAMGDAAPMPVFRVTNERPQKEGQNVNSAMEGNGPESSTE